MGKTYDHIDDAIERWVSKQKVFFISTAPLGDGGLVNCSAKGRDTLRVLDSQTLVYMDGDGSGIETVAHVKENGRIVIMLCAFEGPPKIYRFHGVGEVFEPHQAGFEMLRAAFPEGNCRAIIKIAVTRISDSCGYGVPHYNYIGERSSHKNMMSKISNAELEGYRDGNALSLDGLPGLKRKSNEFDT
jgi:hypothetical protein